MNPPSLSYAAERWRVLRYEAFKRLMDIVASSSGLVVLGPLYLATALVIRIGSPGPVLYRSERIGRQGKVFTLYKFRSMKVASADSSSRVTISGDPRITAVGRVLRKSKLDELPQLWNVFIGEMSLVGYRPEDPSLIGLLPVEAKRLLDHKPGITGAASLYYRFEENVLADLVSGGVPLESAYQQILDHKSGLDLELADLRSIREEFQVLVKTIRSVLETASAA